MLKRLCQVFIFILAVNVVASEKMHGFLTGEAMADLVFAMDSVVDCDDYIFALSHLDGYRYFVELNAISPLDSYRHDEKTHSYSFDTKVDGSVIHHKIVLDWPSSERYGLWYRERQLKGKDKVIKSKCHVENYVRESIRDDHRLE